MSKKAKNRRRIMAAIEAVCILLMFACVANIAGLVCLIMGVG